VSTTPPVLLLLLLLLLHLAKCAATSIDVRVLLSRGCKAEMEGRKEREGDKVALPILDSGRRLSSRVVETGNLPPFLHGLTKY
jgi:hypothetical protein